MNRAPGLKLSNEEKQAAGDEPKTFLERPFLVIATVLAVTVLLLVGLYFIFGIPRDSFQMEIAKALLQVGVVAVAGALLKLVADEHGLRLEEDQKARERAEIRRENALEKAAERHEKALEKADERRAKAREKADERREKTREKANERRERAREKAEEERARDIAAQKIELRYREELLKDTLNRITSTYNQAKKARRKMRALGLNRSDRSDERLILSHYDECMAQLNDAQLELETIIQDVGTNKDAFQSAQEIRTALKAMEKYLGELNGEYEKKRPRTGPKKADVPFDKMDWIRDFLGKAKVLDDKGEKKPSKFKGDFSNGHSNARSLINLDLLNLTSAKNALSSH